MGRIYYDMKVNGRTVWTLFDSESRNSYVTAAAAKHLPIHPARSLRKVAIGGKTHTLRKVCILYAEIEKKRMEMKAYVLSELGRDERGRNIEAIFGALDMQNWGIALRPETESLDLTHYPREFVEFQVRTVIAA